MDRKLKVLKLVLLLRKTSRYKSKEQQIEEAEMFYSDADLDELIELFKNATPDKIEFVEESEEEFEEDSDYIEWEQRYWEQRCREQYDTSSTARDYSPSNPWDAPGMSISDFIKI